MGLGNPFDSPFFDPNPQSSFDVIRGHRASRDQESQTAYTGPGSEYGRPSDGGWKWNKGAGTKFANENPIDPNTGMFEPGKGGLVPHNVALQMQAQSDQGIWRNKQAMMRSGMNYAQGALGLLQSFRPGGGATLEAGIYNQLGMMEFQRAAQTDYLDLLGDYRRKREDDARRAAKKAADKAMWTQIGTAVIGAAAMVATGGAAAPAVLPMMGAIGAAAANKNAGAAGAGAATQPMGAKGGGTGPVPNAANIQNPQGGGGISPGPSGPVPSGPVQGAQADPGPSLSGYGPYGASSSVGGIGSKAAMQSVGGPSGGAAMPSGQQVSSGPGGKSVSGAQHGPMAAGMAPMVGSDGDFSPVAYAAAGARSYSDLPMQAVASSAAASMMENDPFFETITFAVNSRWNQRLVEYDDRFANKAQSQTVYSPGASFGGRYGI